MANVPMITDIDTCIEELRHTVQIARYNYEIWWVYKSKDTRPQYLRVMNKYTPFFQTSIHSHFVATLVALYRLYEKRADTYNIPYLLRILRDAKRLNEAKLNKLDQMYKRAKPLWIKVSVLRNKAFGHRSTAHTVAQVFEEAAVSPDEFRDLIKATEQLLSELSYAWDKSVLAFDLSARPAIIRLLEDLKTRHGPAMTRDTEPRC